MTELDLHALTNVEEEFFQAGFEEGLRHGRIHGLIEGRSMGRQKGFEMWEELGFYRGSALFWRGVFGQAAEDEKETRVQQHIRHLLELIAKFPIVNPSTTSDKDFDVARLMNQIRTRYKALCATIGVRTRLRLVGNGEEIKDEDDPEFKTREYELGY
jgi:primary-amine oxidase